MTAPDVLGLPAAVLALLICPRCQAPVLPRADLTMGQAYDCRAGCRPAPVDAHVLETQIWRALAGTVPIGAVPQILHRIVVDDLRPGGIRLVWRRRRPERPQPSATPPAQEGFLPPCQGRRS